MRCVFCLAHLVAVRRNRKDQIMWQTVLGLFGLLVVVSLYNVFGLFRALFSMGF